jgi:maltose alpha-D-glucosyltransferase/alpha-amylase
MLDNLGRYLEYVLSRRRELKEAPESTPLRMSSEPSDNTVAGLTGDFQVEMIRLLGRRTGEMHLALADVKDKDFAPQRFSQLYQRSVYQTMRNLARSVFQQLQRSLNKLTPEARQVANRILEQQSAILAKYRKLLGKKMSAMKIRVHGDYHLGQVLFTGKDFVIIDFEGEPARPISERRLRRSPLRDVAGMIRSFHYAAHTALRHSPLGGQEDSEFAKAWLEAWYQFAALKFLHSYRETSESAGLLPKRPQEADVLFDVFLLDKAVYELGYELNNRPEWADIPMKGIESLLAQTDN